MQPGQTYGHYEVVAHIGSGGMGDVYRARDTKLGRDVALKTLTPAMSADAERVARFQREARTLATVQHANIASIYGLEETGDVRFLVMELVEGEDLAKRLERGPVHLDEALRIAVQVTEGLEAAHEKGIVHRDLKPANIMLTTDGTVKILDFGLARAWAGDTGDDVDPSMSPTLTAAMTQAGTILGTAAYMSPEQARGQHTDKRADIWAVGVVLFEMLTASRLFAGDTVSDSLAAVLTRDPDLDLLPDATPASVRRALRRCLQRDPRQRLRDAADLRLELLAVDDEPVAAATAATTRARRWPLALGGVAIAAAAVVVGLLAGRGSAPAPEEEVFRLTIPDAGFNAWSNTAISSDGTQIAWVPVSMGGERPLHLRKLSGFESRPLSEADDVGNPFFSPDGDWIGFIGNAQNVLFKMPTAGGSPQRLAALNQTRVDAMWGDDGYIYFSGVGGTRTIRGINRISSDGGEIETVTELVAGDEQHLQPYRVPGGDWLLFTAEKTDGYSVDAVSLATGERVTIAASVSTPRFLAPDIVVLFRPEASEMAAVRVDPGTMSPIGEPVTVQSEVITGPMLRGSFDLSRGGRFVYSQGSTGGLISSRRHIVTLSPSGETKTIFPEQSSWAQPRLSPDGHNLVVRQVSTPDCTLWNIDLERGTRSRVTFDVDAHDPVWNPANGRVIYRFDAETQFFLAERNADGTGETTILLTVDEFEVAPRSFSADGRWLVLDAQQNNGDIWVLDMQSGGEPKPFVSSPYLERQGVISPNGRWIAYTSNESGRDEVFVRAWPAGNPRHVISVDGGESPLFSRDGRTLFFVASGGLMAVDVGEEGRLDPGQPREFLRDAIETAGYALNYDVDVTGERLFAIAGADDGDVTADLRVVLGWGAEVRRLLGED